MYKHLTNSLVVPTQHTHVYINTETRTYTYTQVGCRSSPQVCTLLLLCTYECRERSCWIALLCLRLAIPPRCRYDKHTPAYAQISNVCALNVKVLVFAMLNLQSHAAQQHLCTQCNVYMHTYILFVLCLL